MKALIQIMAAAETGRELYYYTWGKSEFELELKRCHELLTSFEISTGRLWNLLLEYCEYKLSLSCRLNLFSWLEERISNE